MPEPVVIEFSQKGLEQVTDAFRQIAEESKKTSDEVTESSRKMDVSYKQLAFSMSHVVTAGLALESTWTRVAKEQMTVVEGIIRSIPTVISMAAAVSALTTAEAARTAAVIAHTAAEAARAVATGISYAVMSLGAAVPAIAAAAAAGAVAVLAAQASIPSHHYEGPVLETRPYLLEKGQYVTYKRSGAVTIIINEARTIRETGDAVVDALRRAGVI